MVLCQENPIPLDSLYNGTIMWSVYILCVVGPNDLLNKQFTCPWVGTPWHSCDCQSNTAHISGSLDVTTMNIFLLWCPHALIINFDTIIWCYITAFARRIYFCTDVTDPVTTSLFICVSPQNDWHIINNTHSYDFSRRKPVSLLCCFFNKLS